RGQPGHPQLERDRLPGHGDTGGRVGSAHRPSVPDRHGRARQPPRVRQRPAAPSDVSLRGAEGWRVRMDTGAFVAAHRAQCERLDAMSRRRSLSAQKSDELVDLYRRTATHLSLLRSSYADPALVGRLSQSVARARGAVTRAHTTVWGDL